MLQHSAALPAVCGHRQESAACTCGPLRHAADCPLPYVVTFDSQMSDGELPAVAGMLQEAPAKPSPTALQGMMLLDQLGSADARGQFISWQSM